MVRTCVCFIVKPAENFSFIFFFGILYPCSMPMMVVVVVVFFFFLMDSTVVNHRQGVVHQSIENPGIRCQRVSQQRRRRRWWNNTNFYAHLRAPRTPVYITTVRRMLIVGLTVPRRARDMRYTINTYILRVRTRSFEKRNRSFYLDRPNYQKKKKNVGQNHNLTIPAFSFTDTVDTPSLIKDRPGKCPNIFTRT